MIRSALLTTIVVLAGLCITRAGELPTAQPEAVGVSAAKLAELTAALQKLVDDGKVAGGVAEVARRGEVIYRVSFGYRDLASKSLMTDDTIFAIASMSKPITCVAAMTLVEQGKIGLDDPVEKYLPLLKDIPVVGDPKDDQGDVIATVPARRPFTVRDLLAQTSGFSAAVPADPRVRPSYVKAGVQKYQEKGLKTIAEQVERLGKGLMAHQPGEGWTYGMSHDVLGRLIEVVSGQTLEEYLQEHIFRPLDMHDTSFFVPESKRDRMATIYLARPGEGLSPMPRSYGSATYFSGAGGLFSTARDYTRFGQVLLDGGTLEGQRIVRPETIQAMTTNQIGDIKPSIAGGPALRGLKYGLGYGLELAPGADGGTPTLQRYFWGGAFSTRFWVDPPHAIVASIYTQVFPANEGALGVFRQMLTAATEEKP